jgi:hypothetical protein
MRTDRAKVLVGDYDALVGDVSPACLYCLSSTTVQLALAFIEYGYWATRYISRTNADIDQTTIDDWTDKAVYELMTCQEQLQNPICKYDSAGNLLCSYDGGTTFVNSNDKDPRYTTPSLPGITGDNAACKVADSIEQSAEDFRSKLSSI